MGAGKSTLGRQVARRLHLPFFDADVELERRLGVTIATIFEIEGEQAFRDREEAVIAELTDRRSIVLATGGGAITREASRRCLNERGTVVYLHATADTLFARIGNSRNRPMLNVGDPRTRLASLYAERDPLYRLTADHVIESDRETVMRFARTLALGLAAHGSA